MENSHQPREFQVYIALRARAPSVEEWLERWQCNPMVSGSNPGARVSLYLSLSKKNSGPGCYGSA
jgi:hypothetical protein